MNYSRATQAWTVVYLICSCWSAQSFGQKVPVSFDDGEIPGHYSQYPVSPEDNQPNKAKIVLGKKLFFDTGLSRDGTIACATCHQPEHGFASPDPLAVGIDGKVGDRNAPSLINTVFGETFFWDGRADSLETQSLQPITDPREMDSNMETVLDYLRNDKDYVELFKNAFGNTVANANAIDQVHIAKSLAAYERTLMGPTSLVDQFQSGVYASLSNEARQGLWIFESRGNCWKCHSGDNFTDEQFHNTGVSFAQTTPDAGRYLVTKDESDKRKFKTPTLRGIALTGPYMHDGSLATLKDVVQFYNRGGNIDDLNLDHRIEPLGLTEVEIGYLVAFLEALSEHSE